MEEKLISIIVPVCNAEAYLVKCIDSILDQNHRAIEVICVDDGSTDKSLEILTDYQKKDKRIRIISQKNGGLSAARNSGLEIAEGDYVLFLDSDDWLNKQACAVALKAAEKESAEVVMWSYIREYPNNSKPTYVFDREILIWDEKNVEDLRRRFVGLVDDELAKPNEIDSLVTAWGKLYKRSVIGNIRFVDTKIIGSEDVLFNIHVFSYVNKALYLPELYSHYRKDNPNSLSHRYKRQLVYRWNNLYQIIENGLRSREAPEKYYEALSNRICLGLIGLGLNLAEDDMMTFSEKIIELRRILNMTHYRKALGKLQFKYLPIHWKVFFGLAKCRLSCSLYALLVLMNRMRSTGG